MLRSDSWLKLWTTEWHWEMQMQKWRGYTSLEYTMTK